MSPSFPDPVRSAAQSRPDALALIDRDSALSAAALAERAAREAAALIEAGIRPGDIVALDGPPSLDWACAFHALTMAGATVAPLPQGLPREAWRRALDLITPLKAVLAVAGLDAGLSALAEAAGGAVLEPRQAPSPAPERFLSWDETRLLIASSGTGGAPSLCPLSFGPLMMSAFASAMRLGHDPADRWLCALPLWHIGGLSILIRCAIYGITAVLDQPFDAPRVAAALDREPGGAEDITQVSLVPAMLSRVLDHRRAGSGADAPFAEGLRFILVGGAAAEPALIERCRSIAAPIALTWGMTESASQAATGFPGEDRVGPPLPFVRVDAPEGRLELRGPTVAGGHLLTNDRGRIDAEGRVQVEGRWDDVLISGGETIAPEEIEEVLRAHPGIAEAAVVGRRDARWGQRPVAFVVAAAGPIDEQELAGWCRERLAPAKVPDAFVAVASLRDGPLGKVSRARLRARFEDGAPERSGCGGAGTPTAFKEENHGRR